MEGLQVRKGQLQHLVKNSSKKNPYTIFKLGQKRASSTKCSSFDTGDSFNCKHFFLLLDYFKLVNGA